MIALTVNGNRHVLDVEPEMPLLWVIRETFGLTGTKYGCGIAQCGACTVHVDGDTVFRASRFFPRRPANRVTTIEGLSRPHATACRQPGSPSTCRNAAIANRARSWRRPRCCEEAQAQRRRDRRGVADNICRCGTYHRIRAAVHKAVALR